MAFSESTSRAIRLTQLQHFLHKNPHGLTTKELAGLCGKTVRTIQRDILLMQTELHIPVDKKPGGDRYVITGTYLLPPVSLSLYEALVVFLASRLVIRQTDEDNPHVRSALNKIAATLPSPLSQQLKQDAGYLGNKTTAKTDIRIFEQLALAWGTRKRVKISYQSLQRTAAKEWLLDPYFIDMTGTGYSTYVIGKAKDAERERITTFKLDRIKEIELLDEEFEIPRELDLSKLLGNSWGIMWGEDINVKLKFSSSVTRRVKESVWHPTQTVEDLPDGGCLLTVNVGSTLEMTPWIRGWGADVEVLEPKALREDFKRWARELNRMYGKE